MPRPEMTVRLADFPEVQAALAAGRRAQEALTLIRACGYANSMTIAGHVSWGLGEPPAETDPATGRPPRRRAPDRLGQFLRDTTT